MARRSNTRGVQHRMMKDATTSCVRDTRARRRTARRSATATATATANAAASTVTSTARHIRSATLTYISAKEELLMTYVEEYRQRAIAFVEAKEEQWQEVMESVEKYREATRKGVHRLLNFEELPREWQENQYIRTGYRFIASKKECLLSIFRIHNETGNIWTHLLGAVFTLCVAGYCHLNQLPDASLRDHLVFLFFFVAAITCLTCSVMFHTFICHARIKVMKRAATLDYIGISLLISASVFCAVYYGFYCDPMKARLYMSAVGLAGLVGFVLPWFDWFDRKEYRLVRLGIFIFMAAVGVFPVAHLVQARGFEATFQFLYPVLWSLAAYCAGVFFYANHYPECFMPGWFDRWGSSHQLWHVCVVAGIWYQYQAALHYHEHRFTYGCLA